MIAVVMGVSGSGKTTIGTLLAQRLGVVFVDADEYHSDANKAKMAAGHALDDADRAPWLETLHTLLERWTQAGEGGVLACSALKVDYRKVLEGELTGVRFLLLEVPSAVLAERLCTRRHSFMNPVLLGSQLDALEVSPDVLRIENDRSPDDVLTEIAARLAPAA